MKAKYRELQALQVPKSLEWVQFDREDYSAAEDMASACKYLVQIADNCWHNLTLSWIANSDSILEGTRRQNCYIKERDLNNEVPTIKNKMLTYTR